MKKNTYSIINLAIVGLIACLMSSCVVYINKRGGKDTTGKEITKTYNVSSFKGIDAESAIKIVYTVSDTISIKAEGCENDLEHLNITVDSDSILHIRITADGNGNGNNNIINLFSDNNMDDVKVYVSGPAISSVNAEGALDFTSTGVMKIPSMEIEVSGASKIKMDTLETTTFKTTTEGASKIEINQIKAQTASMETSGAGKINVGLANVDKTIFSTEGAGKVKAHFDNCNTATVKVSGAGKVELSGTLHHLDREIDGAAKIYEGNLKTE